MKSFFICAFLWGAAAVAQERLYPIETNDRHIGFIRSDGKVVHKPRFDYLADRSYHGYRWIHADGKAHDGYIKGGKWGLIRLGTADDRLVVEPSFDWIGYFFEGLAPVLVNGQWGFIDTTGRMRIAPQFPDNESPEFDEERIRQFRDEQRENWFIDRNSPEYAKEHGHKFGHSLPPSWYFEFRNGLAWMRKGKSAVIMDTAGHVIKKMAVAPRFGEDLYFDPFVCVIRIGERYGVINRMADTIVPLQDKKINSARFVSGTLHWILVETSDEPEISQWGLMNTKGRWLIEPAFDQIWVRPNDLAWVRKDKLWGLIDTTGQIFFEPQFEQIEHFYEYGMKVRKNKKWGLVDNHGKQIHDCRWDQLGYPDEGMAKIVENGKIGFINREGKILAEPQFRYAEYPNDGFVWVAGDSGWCALDRTGKIAVPPNKTFQFVYGFNEGVAWIRFNNLHGLVDTTGRLIASPSLEFRNPCAFKNGLGWVQNKGTWTLIRSNGEKVFSMQCQNAGDFDGELARIWFNEKKQTYVNKQGKIVWEGE